MSLEKVNAVEGFVAVGEVAHQRAILGMVLLVSPSTRFSGKDDGFEKSRHTSSVQRECMPRNGQYGVAGYCTIRWSVSLGIHTLPQFSQLCTFRPFFALLMRPVLV